VFCHVVRRVPVRAVSTVGDVSGPDEAGERLLQGVGGHGGLLADAVVVEPGEEGAVELLGGAVVEVCS
jgi:hypothetical protein